MDFPRYVFVSPGPTKCPGGSYGCELVHDQAEYDAAIAVGFAYGVAEALEALANPKPEAIAPDIQPDLVDESETASEEPQAPVVRRGRKPRQ